MCVYLDPRGSGDANKKVVQEVGTSAEAQDGVGKLEREMCWLTQLTRCKKREREKITSRIQ